MKIQVEFEAGNCIPAGSYVLRVYKVSPLGNDIRPGGIDEPKEMQSVGFFESPAVSC